MKEKSGEKTAIIVGKLVTHSSYQQSILRLTYRQKGAGVGGVAAAARLAKAGFKVTVFEKNDFTGGRCSLIHHEGYVCHSLLTARLFLTTSSALIKGPRSSSSHTYFEKPSTISILRSKPRASIS